MARQDLGRSVAESLADLKAWESRSARVTTRASAYDDFKAEQLSVFTDSYPETPYGILEAFVQEGLTPDDPVVRSIIGLNYERNAQSGATDRGARTTSQQMRRFNSWRKLHQTDEFQPPPAPLKYEDPDAWRNALTPGQRRIFNNPDPSPLSSEEYLQRRGLLTEDGMLIQDIVEDINEYIEYPDPNSTKHGVIRPYKVNPKGATFFDEKGRKRPEAPSAYVERQEDRLSHSDFSRLKLFYDIAQRAARESPDGVMYYEPKNEAGLTTRHMGGSGGGSSPIEPGVETVPLREIAGGLILESLGNARLPTDIRMPDQRSIRTSGSKLRTTAPEVSEASLFPKDVKGGVRTTLAALDVPFQEGWGLANKGWAASQGRDVDWTAPMSDLMIDVEQGGGNMGSGYLVDPESSVAQTRRDRREALGTVQGHLWTPGRWFADAVNLDPDSFAWDAVSGVTDFAAQVADPSILTLKGISKVSAARRLFGPEESRGLFQGVRRKFHAPSWQSFRESDEWGTIRRIIADHSGDKSSPYDYWKATGKKYDPDIMDLLYQADTEDLVDATMDEIVGPYFRSKHDLESMARQFDPASMEGYNVFGRSALAAQQGLSNWGPVKGFNRMLPDIHMDATNKLHSATQLDRFLDVADVPEEVRRVSFNMIARSTNKNGIEQAAEHAMEATGGILETVGGIADEATRKELTRLFASSRDEAVQSMMDSIIEDVPLRDHLISKGMRVQDLSPHLTIEYLNRFIPLPDVNRIKRLTKDKQWSWLTTVKSGEDIGKLNLPMSLLRSYTDNIWKPGMLLGRFPAWMSRVIGEEQVRMAFSGLDSFFKHPLSAIAIMIGGKGTPDTRWGNFVDRFGSLTATPSGRMWTEMQDYEDSLNRLTDGSIGRGNSSGSSPRLVFKSNEGTRQEFVHAWADQIAIRNFDRVSEHSLNNRIDETVDWLMRGKGRDRLRALREAEPGKFQTEAQVRQYLTETLASDVRLLTNNNTDIIDAMRTGKFRGIDVFKNKNKGANLNPEFVAALDDVFDDAPHAVKGFANLSPQRESRYRNVINGLFSATMGRGTDIMSRSPAMRQLVYQEMADLLPYMDPTDAADILANAKNANASRRLMRKLQRGADAAPNNPTKIPNIESAENLAFGYALERTKKLLYDAAERSDWAESMSIVAPFLNAWQELIFSWGRLMAGETGAVGTAANVLRAGQRITQVVEGGRNNGFISKNQFGEDVFVLPFSQAWTNNTAGVPVNLTGRVEGLSMMTDIWPGLGPVAAIPLAWMLDGKPSGWKDFTRDALLPYGAPGERDPNDATNFLALAPPWFQKFMMAASAGAPPEEFMGPVGTWINDNLIKDHYPSKEEIMYDNAAFMNAEKNVIKYFLSTGNYDVSSREGLAQLLTDAREAAKDLYYVRSMAQFFSPTSPSFEFLAQSKDGSLIAQWAVVEEYYDNIYDKGMDLDQAAEDLIERFGVDMLSLIVPNSGDVTYGIPRTREASNYLKENSWLKDRYPGTYGYFLPDQRGEDTDFSVIVEQYRTGESDVFSPRQWLNLRQKTLANLTYFHYRNMLPTNPSQEQQDWLRQIRSEIAEDYPYSSAGLLDKPDHEELINELYAAVDDPQLSDHPLKEGLERYFYYRDQAVQYAEQSGYATFAQPEAMYDVRIWLSNIAREIIEDYPELEFAWTTTLSREFERELR